MHSPVSEHLFLWVHGGGLSLQTMLVQNSLLQISYKSIPSLEIQHYQPYSIFASPYSAIPLSWVHAGGPRYGRCLSKALRCKLAMNAFLPIKLNITNHETPPLLHSSRQFLLYVFIIKQCSTGLDMETVLYHLLAKKNIATKSLFICFYSSRVFQLFTITY